MRHPRLVEFETRLKQLFDAIDDLLEEKYGRTYHLHPSRPARGLTGNKAHDGLFNVGATFTPGYGSHHGTDELRSAWAAMYQRQFGVVIDPEKQVLPLIGTKEGIFHLPMAILEPGDIVLVPDPGYITYSRGTIFAGGKPHYFPLHAGSGFLPDLDAIPPSLAEKTRILWLNYPNNPTGAVCDLAFFKQVVNFAHKHDILVCHDAAYSQVFFGSCHPPSILQVDRGDEVCIEFNSLSKSHNMAGWRVGAVVGNQQVISRLYRLKTNIDSGHFRPIEDAAVTAMLGDQGWVKGRNNVYKSRADAVVNSLLSLGLDVHHPHATLYVWTKIPVGKQAADFTVELLENTHVSVAPGTFFGSMGEGFIRISITAPESRLDEGMQRIINWIAKGQRI